MTRDECELVKQLPPGNAGTMHGVGMNLPLRPGRLRRRPQELCDRALRHWAGGFARLACVCCVQG